MKIICDACAAKYSIADEKVAGKVFKIRCKKCSNVIVVRGDGKEVAAAAPIADAHPSQDTKVFAYAGHESPQDALAALANDEEWHIVVDEEQVGPMSAADVRSRFAAGDIDSDSYIWKEGFADWQRLPDVPEFSNLSAVATDDSEDAALFGNNAGAADLFGAASSAASTEDLFGGGASAESQTGEAPLSDEAKAHLKGQRNENSVLFSLGNLASLSNNVVKAPVASATSASTSSARTEGSGLIDIRSMASVYLADKSKSAASPLSGSADDLPVFSPSAFESASPVLLPTQSGETDKKLLYTLIGVIAALVVTAAVLIVFVLKGDVATAVAASEIPADASPARVTEKVADDVTENVAAAATSADTTDPAVGGPATGPVEEQTTDTPVTVATDERGTRERKSETRQRKNTATDPGPKTVEKPKPPKRGSCDVVTCLLDPASACCRKLESETSKPDPVSKPSNLPENLSKADILSGIGRIRGRVTSCGDKHGGKGTVMVKLKIGANGKVVSAQASGGGSALRSCVTSAAKQAKFKKTQKGRTVNYPFTFK